MSRIKIRHIVFDLGGVIVNLDPDLTIQAFAQMSDKSAEEIAEYAQQNTLFQNYEKGLISNADFRDGVRELLDTQASDEVIDQAWNAMLLDTPKERLEWMNHLMQTYRVTILSNTNDIHISQVHQDLQRDHGIADFSTVAHQVHYSHQINMRKPDTNIYQYVLDNANYSAEETVFLDDNEGNIIGAQSIGIQTIHITDPNQIPTLLSNAGIKY